MQKPTVDSVPHSAGGAGWALWLSAVCCSLFAASGVPAVAGTPDARIEAVVAAARAARPGEPLEECSVRTLGSSEEMFGRLLPLILGGSKTGTFSLGDPPQVGQCVVVTHFDGAPALIWRVTGVEVMPFDAISERQLAIESPALRELEAWRQVHMTAWAPQLAGKTRAEIGRMPVVVQRFVVIHPRGPAPAR